MTNIISRTINLNFDTLEKHKLMKRKEIFILVTKLGYILILNPHNVKHNIILNVMLKLKI